MQCVVTGAAGQVGTALVQRLAQGGHTVTAFDQDCPSPNNAAHTITGDICDAATLDSLLAGKVDLVFHLAGLNALQPAMQIHRVNVQGTIALLAAAARQRPGRLIVMSSSAVYGPSPDQPITEAAHLSPQTPYAQSKVDAEAEARRYGETGLDICIARPFNIIGPGQRAPLLYNKVAAQLVEMERGTRPPRLALGNLQSFRDVIDVRDVTDGLIAIAQQGASGEIYNICSGAATSMHTMVDTLVALCGLDVTISTAPPGPADVHFQRGAHDKLSAASGWLPRVSLETSLSDTLDWWRHLARRENTA